MKLGDWKTWKKRGKICNKGDYEDEKYCKGSLKTSIK